MNVVRFTCVLHCTKTHLWQFEKQQADQSHYVLNSVHYCKPVLPDLKDKGERKTISTSERVGNKSWIQKVVGLVCFIFVLSYCSKAELRVDSIMGWGFSIVVDCDTSINHEKRLFKINQCLLPSCQSCSENMNYRPLWTCIRICWVDSLKAHCWHLLIACNLKKLLLFHRVWPDVPFSSFAHFLLLLYSFFIWITKADDLKTSDCGFSRWWKTVCVLHFKMMLPITPVFLKDSITTIDLI